MPISERRSDKVADRMADTGIDGPMIERLVHAFYAKVRRDELLGPIFDARIADWDKHLGRMCVFWSSVVLGAGAYHGSPMQAHAPLPVDARHFDRWLSLFEETAAEVCPPAAAEQFVVRARRIAQSLELGVAIHNGRLLRRGERYRMEA
ncbi:MAG TPA: group III truncated hemoglobin [Gammaproteobacteria bacterium]